MWWGLVLTPRVAILDLCVGGDRRRRSRPARLDEGGDAAVLAQPPGGRAGKKCVAPLLVRRKRGLLSRRGRGQPARRRRPREDACGMRQRGREV